MREEIYHIFRVEREASGQIHTEKTLVKKRVGEQVDERPSKIV